MYSSFQLAKKYLHYYIHAHNGKGHGIHSPFVFSFIRDVLNDKRKYDCYDKIESLRRSLLANNEQIEVEDFGAGSAVIKTNTRAISKIAASSLKTKKYAQLLYRIVKYYKPQTIVELGTSFGITSSYMASANEKVIVHTLEGSASIAAIANRQFEKLKLQNIQQFEGSFDKTLPVLLSSVDKIDLAFVDGNHRKQPTLQCFGQLINCSGPLTILIFDDIHWSKEMEEAWAEIQQHPAVSLTIDLFFIGMVFLNPDFKETQHFKIRF